MPGPRIALLAAGLGVAVWRAAALALVAGRPDFTVKALLAAVGIVFLACGLSVYWRLPRGSSLLLAAFCLCSALHWGGPLELPAGALRTVSIVFYVAASGLLGEIFFLRFALCFPAESPVARRGWILWLLYAPLVAAVVLAFVDLPAFLLFTSVAGNLLAIVAFAFIASHLFRSRVDAGGKKYVGLMVAGMLAAWVPYLVAGGLGLDAALWTLSFAALPVSFTIAIDGIERTRSRA